VRQGISWWRAVATAQWALRPGQESERPAPDSLTERYAELVGAAMSRIRAQV